MQGWLTSAGLSEAWVNYLIIDSSGKPTGWRLLMLIGAAPAVLTFFIRLMVPESQKWQHEQQTGKTSNWATRDLLGVLIGSAGPLFMIYLWARDRGLPLQIGGSIVGLIVALVGYTYPVYRYLQRSRSQAQASGAAPVTRFAEMGPTLRRMLLGACLSGVALLGTWASVQRAPTWADKLAEKGARESQLAEDEIVQVRGSARAFTQIVSAIGAIVGTMLGAVACDGLGRRWTYSLLCLGSLVSSLLFFQLNTSYGPMFLVSVFFAGGLTASFYGWLPLYLPELFPTSVRATGQGFSFNFGRILAAVGALQTGNLIGLFSGGIPAACSVMSLVYLVGMVLIWFAPETRGQPLPE
jgi:MFS family permease